MLKADYLFFFLVCLLGNCCLFSMEINPDHEDSEILDTFLTALEKYSGLSSVNVPELHSVPTSCPNYSECFINANGTILWDIRLQLYAENMAQSFEDEDPLKILTLDGCLNSTTTKTAYNECMETVRSNMLTFLYEKFDTLFAKAVEENECQLANSNCISINDII